jgi:hypothetical protein
MHTKVCEALGRAVPLDELARARSSAERKFDKYWNVALLENDLWACRLEAE